MGKLKAKVSSVTELGPNTSVNPILVRFEHAAINPNVNGDVDLNRIFGAAVFQSAGAGSSRDMSHLSKTAYGNREEKGTKRKQVVALQSDMMTYIGTKGFDNPTSVSSTDDMMKTYVALKHKKKMKIYEVMPVTVSPYLEGHSYVVEKPRDTGIEKSKDEKKEAASDLVKAFGSKKKRLTYERTERNQIDISDMQQSIDAAVDKVVVPEEEPVLRESDSILTLIPPCNRNASTVQDVYLLEDILLDEELDEMEELVDGFFEASPSDIKKWKLSKKYSDYFFAMLAKLQSKRRDSKTIKVAKIVLYTELLIFFLKLKHEQIRKKRVDLPQEYPPWLNAKVVENFTTLNANGSRNRSEAYKDKTICYIMVLVLLANDLHFDVQLMSTSLQIPMKKLLTLAKAVGITLIYNANTKEHRGILKLPLPKPIENRGRRKALRH